MVTALVHYCSCLKGESGGGCVGGREGGRKDEGERDGFYVLIIAAVITVCESGEDSEYCRPTQKETRTDVITHKCRQESSAECSIARSHAGKRIVYKYEETAQLISIVSVTMTACKKKKRGQKVLSPPPGGLDQTSRASFYFE